MTWLKFTVHLSSSILAILREFNGQNFLANPGATKMNWVTSAPSKAYITVKCRPQDLWDLGEVLSVQNLKTAKLIFKNL